MSATFPPLATTAYPVYFRSYSRRLANGNRENWEESTLRVAEYLREIGKLNDEEFQLILDQQLQCKTFFSGRLNWVGGTDWIKKPQNFYGAYNCSQTLIHNLESFGLLMNLAMQGTGTGALLEPKFIEQLPTVVNRLNVSVVEPIGFVNKQKRNEDTDFEYRSLENEISLPDTVSIFVGDSRQGWVDSYVKLLELATDTGLASEIEVKVFLGDVRPKGENLKGFGGVANPAKLPQLYPDVADILNKAVGRKLNSVECCLIIDKAAYTIVAGGIRRSAGIRQFLSTDTDAAKAKDNLWEQDSNGAWKIDPERDALRMANHTRVFHHKPSLEEITQSVTKQYYSGEGAIQFAPEAIARANADLLNTDEKRKEFIRLYCDNEEKGFAFLALLLKSETGVADVKELEHRMVRYGFNPCAEIGGVNFLCNLGEIHLNQLDPLDLAEQEKAFKAAAISVSTLLHHQFIDERYQYSREIDPIVGVSFTGLFDFFVKLFGVDWLKWWEAGRPKKWDVNAVVFQNLCDIADILEIDVNDPVYLKTLDGYDGELYKLLEKKYLEKWKSTVQREVEAYCKKHGLRVPNRCTALQPSGSKSLLTGASPGWHPPKAARYIRRITFDRDNAIALACMDYGYSVIPGQDDKDEMGNLLTDPHDPRCTQWLVEIPCQTVWADLPGCDQIDISKFSVAAQFDFCMQVQKHYVMHNTSSTLELRENEITELSQLIYESIQNDEGYISAALLARFDARETMPRMPFEPISRETFVELFYSVLTRRKSDDFLGLLAQYDKQEIEAFNQGAMGCDSDKCLMPEKNTNITSLNLKTLGMQCVQGFKQGLESISEDQEQIE